MSLPHVIVALVVAAAPLAPAAQGGGSAPVTLEGTSWNAVEVVGTAVAADMVASGRGPHLVFGEKGRLAGSDGCNRLMGPYTVKENGITFGELAGTMMACPKTDELAQQFRSALKGTGHWSIVKERLEFYGATGRPLAVFERRVEKAPAAPVKAPIS